MIFVLCHWITCWFPNPSPQWRDRITWAPQRNLSSPFITTSSSYFGDNKWANGKEIPKKKKKSISWFHLGNSRSDKVAVIYNRHLVACACIFSWEWDILKHLRVHTQLEIVLYCAAELNRHKGRGAAVCLTLFWCWRYSTTVSEFLGGSRQAALKWNYIINSWCKWEAPLKLLKGHPPPRDMKRIGTGAKLLAGWAKLQAQGVNV